MLQDQDRICVVRYRIENAYRTLDEVSSHIKNGFYNTAVNRMYYACYYAVSALLVTKQITSKSHGGVKQMFSLHYVKTGIVPKEFGKFYNGLFEERSTGDYEDLFNHDQTTCEELFPMAKEFVAVLGQLGEAWLKEQENKE